MNTGSMSRLFLVATFASLFFLAVLSAQAAPPPAPTLTSPASGTVGIDPTNAALSWQPVSGDVLYYEVKLQPVGGDPTTVQVMNSPITYNDLDDALIFIWWVGAVNGDGETWSAPRSFQTTSATVTPPVTPIPEETAPVYTPAPTPVYYTSPVLQTSPAPVIVPQYVQYEPAYVPPTYTPTYVSPTYATEYVPPTYEPEYVQPTYCCVPTCEPAALAPCVCPVTSCSASVCYNNCSGLVVSFKACCKLRHEGKVVHICSGQSYNSPISVSPCAHRNTIESNAGAPPVTYQTACTHAAVQKVETSATTVTTTGARVRATETTVARTRERTVETK